MANFPTFSRAPIVGGLEEVVQDDRVYIPPEAGPDVVRTSVTRLLYEFPVQWQALNASDIAAERAWWTTYRATYTTWTHPDTTTWSVIHKPESSPVVRNAQALGLYDVSMVLRGYVITGLPSVGLAFYGGPTMIEIEELAPGVSISARPIFAAGMDLTITAVNILTKGAPDGIDDSNTAVLTIKKNGGATVVTKTYNTGIQPPSSALADLGTILTPALGEDEWLTLDLDQTGTAHMPAFILILERSFS